MQIILKNDYGSIVIGCNGGAKLIDISGLGMVEKETQTVTYAGQPGQTTISLRDMPRTITMSIDFKGNQDEVLKLYRIVYHKVDIFILSGQQRRAISGICINQYDVEQIIYHKMYSAVLQFVCDDPYFHDVTETKFDLNKRTDQFPNSKENGEYYISLPAAATIRTNNLGVMNKGVIKVYPVIEIYNNTASEVSSNTIGIVATNHTIGKAITINRDMKPSENCTLPEKIDSKKLQKTE